MTDKKMTSPRVAAQRYDSTAELNHDGSPFGVMTPTPTGQYVHQSALREALRRLEMTDGWNADLAKRLDGAEATIKIMEAGTRRDQAALKASTPEPTAMEPLPDAPEGEETGSGLWESYADELCDIAEERGLERDQLKSKIAEMIGAMTAATIDLKDYRAEVESLKAQLVADPAPAPQSPDPWEVLGHDIAFSWLWREGTYSPDGTKKVALRAYEIGLEAIRAADQATIAGLESVVTKYGTDFDTARAHYEETIAERDAEIAEKSKTIYRIGQERDAAIAAKEEAETTARVLRETLDQDRNDMDRMRERAEEAEATLEDLHKDQGAIIIAREAADGEVVERELRLRKAETALDTERERADDAETEREKFRVTAVGKDAEIERLVGQIKNASDNFRTQAEDLATTIEAKEESDQELSVFQVRAAGEIEREQKAHADTRSNLREVWEAAMVIMAAKDAALDIADETEERVRVLEGLRAKVIAHLEDHGPCDDAEEDSVDEYCAAVACSFCEMSEAAQVIQDTTPPDDPPAEEPTTPPDTEPTEEPAARLMTEEERKQFPADEDWSWLCLLCCGSSGMEQMIDGANRDLHKVCRFCGITPHPETAAPQGVTAGEVRRGSWIVPKWDCGIFGHEYHRFDQAECGGGIRRPAPEEHRADAASLKEVLRDEREHRGGCDDVECDRCHALSDAPTPEEPTPKEPPKCSRCGGSGKAWDGAPGSCSKCHGRVTEPTEPQPSPLCCEGMAARGVCTCEPQTAEGAERCPLVCPHGDRCRLEAGHEKKGYGCSHALDGCHCNERNAMPTESAEGKDDA